MISNREAACSTPSIEVPNSAPDNIEGLIAIWGPLRPPPHIEQAFKELLAQVTLGQVGMILS